MKLIGRRNFVASLGLGGAYPLLSPLCRQIVGDAQGADTIHRRFVFVTQANAWNHHYDLVGAVSKNTGQKSWMFRAGFRGPQDFDLPVWLQEPFGAYQRQVAIWMGLTAHRGDLTAPFHGCTETVLRAAPKGTGGISIDRLIGQKLKARYGDLHDSTSFCTYSPQYRSPAFPGYDGPGRRAAVYVNPVKAFAGYFGSAVGISPQQVQSNIELNKSLFDGIRQDLSRARGRLAPGLDVQKFDQATESMRDLEEKLQSVQMRLSDPAFGAKPAQPTVNKGDTNGFARDVIDALTAVMTQTQAYGLTHVSHLSLSGEAAFSDGADDWRPIAGPGLSFSGNMHADVFHDVSERGSENCRKIHKSVATMIAGVRKKLEQVGAAGGSMADDTVFIWLTQGGMRHHQGNDAQLLLLLAGSRTKVRAPNWADYFSSVNYKPAPGEYSFGPFGTRHMGQAYVSLANAADIDISSFGNAQGSLPDVLKT